MKNSNSFIKTNMDEYYYFIIQKLQLDLNEIEVCFIAK